MFGFAFSGTVRDIVLFLYQSGWSEPKKTYTHIIWGIGINVIALQIFGRARERNIAEGRIKVTIDAKNTQDQSSSK